MATVKDSMSSNPITISVKQSVQEASELMRSNDVGDLIVAEDNRVVGVVTDRDIVVRVIATGGSTSTEVREACSSDLVTVSPEDPIADAVRLMREKAMRRIPVLDGGSLVGILSIGDLAIDHDPDSALADVSAEEPNV